MRVVAMVSGGKDSCYNMMQCVAEGHEIVALANLHPKDRDELDSYMYQTVGHMGIEKLAEAMAVPLYRRETNGLSKQTGSKQYVPTDDDEVEDLFNLLKWTKDDLNVEAVSVGAILSDYQRIRVENVCARLNLISLAYLWRRDQTELLQEMIDCQVHAIIIKIAALGLDSRHLGKSIREMQPHLVLMRDKYGLNVCGEGGEYETFTLNCPLFKQQIVVEDMQSVISSSDPVCPVGYINFTKIYLADKQLEEVFVKRSIDYLSDLNESSYSDLSDPDLSESELEQIELENRLKESLSKDELAITMSRSNSISNSVQSSPVKCPLLYRKNQSVDFNMIDQQSISPSFFIATENLSSIRNTPNFVQNSKGWMWISGIQGYGSDPYQSMVDALNGIKAIITSQRYQMSDVCYVTLYVRDMSDYRVLNEAYGEMFNFPNPPTRVCVECPLANDCQVIVEAVAHRPRNEVDEIEYKRHTMHVQGISHWAPANIGTYSQSTKIGEITYISGQIALIPGSMDIIDGGIRPQCKLALRHIGRIANAMNSHGQLRHVVQGICFITHPSYIGEARRQWERRSANAIVDYIVVPALPKQALVEWQVWAHSHNDRFDYEETGCKIGDYTIFSRRRWNYENNCAAIVCYVSTGLCNSTTQLTDLSDDFIVHHRRRAEQLTGRDFNEILQYTLQKLLKGYSPKSSDDNVTIESLVAPAIHLKVFYQVTAAPSIDLLMDALDEFKVKNGNIVRIAYTVLPACCLHNFSTYLSICGVRHE